MTGDLLPLIKQILNLLFASGSREIAMHLNGIL